MKAKQPLTALLLGSLHGGPAAAQARPGERFDILITGGQLLDGSGNPWFRADVGIRGDRLAAIGDLRGSSAGKVIDVQQRQKSLMETFRNVRSNGADLDPKTGVRMPRRE